jgi:type I restriction-modification system DNA methylase subunit
MPRGRTKKRLADLDPQPDSKAELDSAALLSAAQPVLKLLAKDLLERANASAAVSAALKVRHEKEQADQRTADSLAIWKRKLAGQVAVAWLLSCVFVRVLEDRGLIGRNRIAGPGAMDSQRLFFELAPSLTVREYLLTIFRELTRLPAARDLFDGRHNLVWKLAPSADATRKLLELFRTPDAEAPAFRFGSPDTRFLGDLYQDLDEDVRKNLALLQTPRFVEELILDETLEPAISEFGLARTTLLDPTCGGGHFLLGAFERLTEHRLRTEPGLDVREAARQALDAVYGADINPYAIAIARFRLTLAYLDKADYTSLVSVPALPIHLAAADSLLHNPHLEQTSFKDIDGESAADWEGDQFKLEDEEAARDVLHRQHAAVVGNPPYITEKDKAKRELYRAMYESAAGKFALAAPFVERFFKAAMRGGFVGMINSNAFMKREFGKKLITDVLPRYDLQHVVDTSGAYIPGHGTPTVLLFGRHQESTGDHVAAVLGKRGEPTTPEKPEQGEVWASVRDHHHDIGFENDYISVAKVERQRFCKHPWSLGGGGAGELKALLESRCERRLGGLATDIGFDAIMGEDDIFTASKDHWDRWNIPESKVRQFVEGQVIRDWALSPQLHSLFPYDENLAPIDMGHHAGVCRYQWPYRTTLVNRMQFGKNTLEAGLEWFEYRSFYKSKRRTPLSIAFAFVATHNHFVLDRGGKVFKQTAPIIKLPEEATEEDHLALLGYLNSSTACFWLKQVCMNKGATSDKGVLQADPEKFRFEFDGSKLLGLPLPTLRGSERSGELLALSTKLDEAGQELARNPFREGVERGSGWTRDSLSREFSEIEVRRETLRGRMITWQEELDWLIYEMMGIIPKGHPAGCRVPELSIDELGTIDADWRAYRSHGDTAQEPKGPGEATRNSRLKAIKTIKQIRILETPENKRRWFRSRGKFDATNITDIEVQRETIEEWLTDKMEAQAASTSQKTLRQIIRQLEEDTDVIAATEVLTGEASPHLEKIFSQLMGNCSVPFSGPYRYSTSGLEKRAAWEETWELQRREDAGETVIVPIAPKFKQSDFRSSTYWRLRGKLDVPKERFISYPGCEGEEDTSPLVGWAGWDHAQQAKALGALYWERRTVQGWDTERLKPMLAGLLELVPWLKQWHNEPDPEMSGQGLGDYFAGFVQGQCLELGISQDDLREWRPPERKARRGRKKKGAS